MAAVSINADIAVASAAERETSRTALFALLLALMFLWPFELPIAMGASGIVRPVLGDWYVLCLHATCLAVVSLLIISRAEWPTSELRADPRMIAVMALIYLGVGVLALPISSIEPVQVKYAYQQLVCGYVAPVAALAAILSLPASLQSRVWTSFYAGWVAFLLVSLVLLRVSWVSGAALAPAGSATPFLQKVVFWRYTMGEPWNIYGLVMGNANKMSNYVLIFLLFSVKLLARPEGRRSLLLGAFWVLGILTLLVMFSRAALLLLLPVVLLSGITGRVSRSLLVALVIAAIGGLVAVYLIEPGVFEYLFLARVFGDSDPADVNPAGTFVDRVEMWSALLQYFSAYPAAAWHGLGTTGYGLTFFHRYENGTHNLFLDLWAEAGIVAPLLFVLCIGMALFAIGTARRASSERFQIASGMIILVLLMTREHSLSYLYVTSLGGLCFLVVPYMAVRQAIAPDGTRTPVASGESR